MLDLTLPLLSPEVRDTKFELLAPACFSHSSGRVLPWGATSSMLFSPNHLISLAYYSPSYLTLHLLDDSKKLLEPAVRNNRDATSSISGHSSYPGIHQVLPTSFILALLFSLTLQYQGERNPPWHAWLLESLLLSSPIMLIQPWWNLILPYRRQTGTFSLFSLYVVFYVWTDIKLWQQFSVIPSISFHQRYSSQHWEEESKVKACLALNTFLLLSLQLGHTRAKTHTDTQLKTKTKKKHCHCVCVRERFPSRSFSVGDLLTPEVPLQP